MDTLDFIVLNLLSGAAYTDILYGRIYNNYLLVFIFIGIVLKGMDFIFYFMLSLCFGFVLFLFSVIGAGDIKLLALIYGLQGYLDATIITVSGLVLAAIYALYHLISKNLLLSRLNYFRDFVVLCLSTKTINKYYDMKRATGELTMPLAPWFWLGFVLWRIYILCRL